MADDSLPPPPPGFEVDQPQAASGTPPPPPGFEVDQPQSTPPPPPGFQLDSEKYSSPVDKVLTGVEGVARGLTGHLSDALAGGMRNVATKLGVPDEDLHYIAPSKDDLQGRENTNPAVAKTSEFGGNLAGMMAMPEVKFANAGRLLRGGTLALNGALQVGGYQAADQLSNYLMGNKTDPASIWKAAAYGAAGGGALGLLGEGGGWALNKMGYPIKSAENALSSIITGAGHSAQFPEKAIVDLSKSAMTDEEREMINPGLFKIGQKLYQSLLKAPLAQATGYGARDLVNAFVPESHPIGKMIAGGAADVLPFVTNLLENPLAKYIPKGINDRVSAALLNAAKSGKIKGIDNVISGAAALSRGDAVIGKTVKALFNKAPKGYLDIVADERERDKLDKRVNELNPISPSPSPTPAFAEGGQVDQEQPVSNPMHEMYPELGMAMDTAKGRIKGYLKSFQPNQNKTRLTYDINQKNPHEEREYHKVLGLAAKPLSILKKIKNGSLTTKDIKHFTALYPELHTELSNRIHEQIAESRLKEDPKPDYKMRQSLSLFLGSDLDSSMTPSNIMAAQSVFNQQKQNQQQVEAKQEQALSKMGQNSQTPGQAREKALTKT